MARLMSFAALALWLFWSVSFWGSSQCRGKRTYKLGKTNVSLFYCSAAFAVDGKSARAQQHHSGAPNWPLCFMARGVAPELVRIKLEVTDIKYRNLC